MHKTPRASTPRPSFSGASHAMSSPTRFAWFSSPIGDLLLTAREGALTSLHMIDDRSDHPIPDDWREGDDLLKTASEQLGAYFEGRLQRFDLPINLIGTPFQLGVWERLRKIPYGETISYMELARRVGNPSASRAVGSANGRNPISIIVPCHRVIAAAGTLGGYGGGLDRKLWLLEHEAHVLGREAPESWAIDKMKGRETPHLVLDQI